MNSILGHGFKYEYCVASPDGAVVHSPVFSNLLPQVGINHIAGMLRGDGTTPIGSWFMFLYEGNYIPTSGVTAADLPGVVGECVAYSDADRPAWTHAYDGVSVISNLAAKAVFTMTSDKRIYGAGIIASSTKGGNTGLLLSIAKFPTPVDLITGAQFSLGAGLALIPTT